MNQKQIEAVFSDETFVESLFEMESPEAVQAAVKEKGIELTLDDIAKIRDTVVKNDGKAGDELNLGELDDVAGGALITTEVSGVTSAVSVVTISSTNVQGLSTGRW